MPIAASSLTLKFKAIVRMTGLLPSAPRAANQQVTHGARLPYSPIGILRWILSGYSVDQNPGGSSVDLHPRAALCSEEKRHSAAQN